jgi:hypothetical protein
MVNALSIPQSAATAPPGLIEPPVPALAVIVNGGFGAKLAAMVWAPITVVNV